MSSAIDVIVATSDASTRSSLVTAVEALGHQVTTASDSAQLLRLAMKVDGQLAFVDTDLGPLGGVELISLLRDMQDDMLIVPMAEGSTEQEFALRSLGIFYYMLKPVDGAELRDVLASATRRIGAESSSALPAR